MLVAGQEPARLDQVSRSLQILAEAVRDDAMTAFDYIGIIVVIILILWLLLRD
jgi:hypothetical protein